MLNLILNAVKKNKLSRLAGLLIPLSLSGCSGPYLSPFDCGKERVIECGHNSRGTQTERYDCEDESWKKISQCHDSDVCKLNIGPELFYSGSKDTQGEGACQSGLKECKDAPEGAKYFVLEPEILPEKEICDSLDNDCDGLTDEELLNICGGCPPLDANPGDSCGDCGTYQCQNKNLVCDDLGFNDCGGCQPLERIIGEPCGECGTVICEDKDKTRCDDSGYIILYHDRDNDDFGDLNHSLKDCSLLPGYVKNNQDCNDNNIAVNPNAQEACDNLDNNCNGLTDEDLTRPNSCGVGVCSSNTGVEKCFEGAWRNYSCNPYNGSTPEACNGLDDDCDGLADEDLTRNCSTACGTGLETCFNGSWQNCTAPLPTEEVCDGSDNNCDGKIDENLGSTTCGIGECQRTVQNCIDGQPQTCIPRASLAEVCDGKDNNCNRDTDEGLLVPFYRDLDDDGYGDPDYILDLCPQATPAGFLRNNLDCKDNDASVNPSINEICDGLDNNCDGEADENLTPSSRGCTAGIGECASTGTEYPICNGSAGWSAEYFNCTAVAKEPVIELCDYLDNDCDSITDNNFLVGEACTSGLGECSAAGKLVCASSKLEAVCDAVPKIPAEEICDGLDNNCDGGTDESLASPSRECTAGVGECTSTGTEYKICQGSAGWSAEYFNCTAVAKEPVIELCDYLDNDCDGDTDENFNVGVSCISGVGECVVSGNYVCNFSKLEAVCDAVPKIPAEEICDGLDNDCNNLTDENLIRPTTCGVGNCEGRTGSETCKEGIWENNTCNPFEGAVEELCDNLDNDCDGSIDEENSLDCTTYYKDSDSDGYGQCDDSKCLCSPEGPYTITSQQEYEIVFLKDIGEVALNGSNPKEGDSVTLGGWSYYHAASGVHYGKYTENAAYEGALGIQLKGHGTRIESPSFITDSGTASVKTRMVNTDGGVPTPNFLSTLYLLAPDWSKSISLETRSNDYNFYYKINNTAGTNQGVIPGGCSHNNLDWWTYTIELTNDKKAVFTVDDGTNICSIQLPHGIQENFTRYGVWVDRQGSGGQWAIADYDNLSFLKPSNCDCDDENLNNHPDSEEICDSLDNDCDGNTDEGNICGN